VGIPDFSIAWTDETPRTKAPEYFLGKMDWRELCGALGIGGLVVERDSVLG
jgi:hypothetical protein